MARQPRRCATLAVVNSPVLRPLRPANAMSAAVEDAARSGVARFPPNTPQRKVCSLPNRFADVTAAVDTWMALAAVVVIAERGSSSSRSRQEICPSAKRDVRRWLAGWRAPLASHSAPPPPPPLAEEESRRTRGARPHGASHRPPRRRAL